MKHLLSDCFAVWYNPFLHLDEPIGFDYSDELCEQRWADLNLDGINTKEANKARYGKKK